MICKSFVECLSLEKKKSDERCEKCKEISSNTNIPCKEKGRRYTLQNDKKLTIANFWIDGGVYVDKTESKCDRLYYIVDEPKTTVIFIELKGRDIKHALEQLIATATQFKGVFENDRKFFRIVCSGAPKIANDKKCIKLKETILKLFKTMPLIKEMKIEEKYSELK